jgi:glycosyltransferase involved in cell wall biosynthesis
VERLGLSGAVRFLGFVEDQELLALYAGATALILPSWFESFGFPALEAMACGTPVLAARVGALPDLLGDAAIFFAPDAPWQMAEHMTRVSSDEDLRRDLGARGRQRAAGFTWERAATETLEVLREAGSSDG